MANNTADQLFAYLRDLLYNPDAAALDIDTLDEDYKKLGEGLMYFAMNLQQTRELAASLAKGNLSVKLPPPDNQLAAPLKALHASLKHLTWTSQQVAKGDYQQRLDFLGEFAEAFNTMTEQLDYRQSALEAEIENSRRKTLALEQNISLLEAVTNEMQQWIVVQDVATGETLFLNRTAREGLREDNTLETHLRALSAEEQKEGVYNETLTREVEINDSMGKTLYFSVVTYPMHWKEHTAVAHVITDISDEKRHVQRLENYAYQDNLTGIANRYYGMKVLRGWLEEKRHFSMCFVDLDNLKFVNDNFGHSEGDVYIITAARLLKDSVEGAEVCRLGGDEFMLLVPGMGRDALEEQMYRVREALIQYGKDEARAYMCSLSYGVVEVPAGSDISSGELLSVADERMYEFKRKHKMGRGKTMFPGGGGPAN